MPDKINISVIILTYNEEISVKDTLESIINHFSEIVILDSYSNDQTIDICKRYTNKIFFRQFDNFKNQRNYAIQKLEYINDYIFFLDADEIVSKELIEELYRLKMHDNVAYSINRKFYWYDKWMKYGGYYPLFLTRIGHKNKIYFDGIVNEHMIVDGNIKKLDSFISDKFNKPFINWIMKHIQYSYLEANKHFISDSFMTENFKSSK